MIHKRNVALLSVFLILALFTQAFASNGTQIGTVGARSTAMASAFRGLADDWSALFFNPAGLTQLEGWTFGASTGIIMPRGCYTQDAYPVYPFSGMYARGCDATAQNFFVPSMGIFKQLNESVVVGLGVYAPFGLGTEWDLMEIPASYGNATGLSKTEEHYSDHQVITVQPTIAFKLSDKISMGLGVSYVWGKMDLDVVKLGLNPVLAEVAPGITGWQGLQLGLAAMGVTLPDLTADQHRVPVENNLSGHGSAFGVNFGLRMEFNEKFSMGISARYFSDLKLKGDLLQTYIFSGDPVKAATLQAVPAVAFADADDPTGVNNKNELLLLFSGQNYPETFTDVDAPLPLPLTAGIGFAYKFSPRFTMTLDVSMTRWSAWDIITVEDDGEEIAAFEENWDNTIQAGFGYEALIADKENSQIFWRGGFYSVDSPAIDETMTPTILDPKRRFVITQGLGAKFGKIALNLCYEYIFFGDKTVEDYNFNPENGTAENNAGLYEFKAHVITFGTSIDL